MKHSSNNSNRETARRLQRLADSVPVRGKVKNPEEENAYFARLAFKNRIQKPTPEIF